MKLLLPDNIFAKIISLAISNEEKPEIHFLPSSLLSKKLVEHKDAVAFIPTLDLLNHKEFFISSQVGISFDESVGNSYIYFSDKEKIINEVILAGDPSVNEGILTKILFSETYGVEVNLSFEKANGGSAFRNIVLCGDRNFIEGNIESAISFTEEMIELISAPYVNSIFVSQSEELLTEFHSRYQKRISEINSAKVFESLSGQFPQSSKNYLAENLQHVMFSFDEQDLEGIQQLLQLPYFHGIVKDMIDAKFV